MSMREWVNNNSILVTSMTLVALVVALGAVILQQRAPAYRGPSEVYFWDMETDEPFAASIESVPPIEAPSGGRGVRAYLHSCGECTPGEWFGYLETHTDEARRFYEEEGILPMEEDVTLVRPLEGGDWVSRDRDGRITARVSQPCDPDDADSFPQRCLP